jgi:hypothetical protein
MDSLRWDLGDIFRPLGMSKILGYPRQRIPQYKKKWFPNVFGNDDTTAEKHE